MNTRTLLLKNPPAFGRATLSRSTPTIRLVAGRDDNLGGPGSPARALSRAARAGGVDGAEAVPPNQRTLAGPGSARAVERTARRSSLHHSHWARLGRARKFSN